MPQVTIIPATRDLHTGIAKNGFYKKKVAGYARVSTNNEEQLTSYEAQVDYYTKYIQSRADWQFVKVYTDEGISATNTKHRDGFNEMISAALEGKIDLIVTKSVSRFARNTVDSLTTVRKLKDKGVEVYFEKENIYTLDSKGELLITIMSSLAQEESRSISENVTWGKRKAFADGKVYLPYKNFLGYRKGEDGLPEIVPEEAEVIRLIYRLFFEGKTTYLIAEELTSRGVPTPTKRQSEWQSSTVESILSNEKYKGSALLQKKFTTSFLEKKMKVNEGEVPQYYIENSHPAIITPGEYEMARAELQRRKGIGHKYSGKNIFASKIVCGDCGSYYGPKAWHSNSIYYKIIYRCNSKYKTDKHKCGTPTLTEDTIKDAFIEAINKLLIGKTQLIDDCRIMQTMLSDTSEQEIKLGEKNDELDIVRGLLAKCIESNSKDEQDQEAFWQKYNCLEERYNTIKVKIEKLYDEIKIRRQKAENIGAFMFELNERDGIIDTFDERLWFVTVDRVVVNKGKGLVFEFKNGIKIEVA
ncbi:MAG: recombinase family protein, partial [Eubacteriales bacterium]|nr:recombinase family protein [Eubacteriales bacterium]